MGRPADPELPQPAWIHQLLRHRRRLELRPVRAADGRCAMSSDLRVTLGWHLTRHARQAAANRGFGLSETLLTAARPDIRYTSSPYGPGREIRIRGDLAVAVHAPSRTVITVLWHREQEWTDAEA